MNITVGWFFSVTSILICQPRNPTICEVYDKPDPVSTLGGFSCLIQHLAGLNSTGLHYYEMF
jgi:hypothetical protein